MPLAAAIVGLLAAAYVYLLKEGLGARLYAKAGLLYTFFYNKWYFDEIYDFIFVRGAKALGDLFWKVGDQKVIDGFGPNGVSAVAAFASASGSASWQTGYLYHYAFVMLLGVAGLLSYALFLMSVAERGADAMIGILSLTTFSPLIGVAAILILKAFAGPDQAEAVTSATRAGSPFGPRWRPSPCRSCWSPSSIRTRSLASSSWSTFPGSPARTTAWAWTGSRVLFVLLTAFLMPLCIAASVEVDRRNRVAEYFIAFLILGVPWSSASSAPWT